MKKAPSGYWLWLGEHRAEIVAALGGVKKAPEVSKKAGEMWKAMSATAQAPYLERSQKMKDELQAAKADKDNSKEVEGMRKKPMTPVFAFIQEKREEIAAMPGISGLGAISKKGAELFKNLSAADQAARKKIWEDQMVAYNLWKESEEGQTALDLKKGLVADKKAAKKEKLEKKQAKFARKEARAAKAAGIEIETSKDDAADATTTPTKPKTGRGKRAAGATSEKPPLAKKAKVQARGGKAEEPSISIETDLLQEAKQLGFESALKNLASRKEIVSSGKSGSELLAALVKSEGLVNPAKHALLGA